MAGMDPVNVDAMLARFSEHWSPKKIAQINDYDVRIVKLQGDFTWHKHDDTEELFLVLGGELTIQMRDRNLVLGPRDLFVVPRGVEHCPRADTETAVPCWSPAASSIPAMPAESSPPRLKRCPEDQSAPCSCRRQESAYWYRWSSPPCRITGNSNLI